MSTLRMAEILLFLVLTVLMCHFFQSAKFLYIVNFNPFPGFPSFNNTKMTAGFNRSSLSFEAALKWNSL